MNRKRYLIIAGIVVAAALISILSYTMLGSHRLAITNLKAEANWVDPSGSLNVTCNATAPRGDELSYNWSASGGKITGGGATVTWTAPISAGSYNVTVTVTDSHGGEVTKNVTIEVRGNEPPVIKSLVADANWTTPAGSLRLTCNATDPDGDLLNYEWTTTGGNLSGAGAVVNWTAPQGVGAYNITVVVKDGYGGEARRFVTLTVAQGTPPTIENLIVTAKGNPYLKKSSTPGCDYDVWMLKQYDIECIASNTSGELFYDWSYTDGNISGEGPTITWTAPNKKSTSTVSVDVTVTAIVSDGAGNSIAKSIVFHIPTCTCGF
jgi:Bacterial Ig domain